MLVDEHRDIVADIEDEPDRDEAGDAVTVNLQEIPNDVSIEKFHSKISNFEFRLQSNSKPAISKEHRKTGNKSFKF